MHEAILKTLSNVNQNNASTQIPAFFAKPVLLWENGIDKHKPHSSYITENRANLL